MGGVSYHSGQNNNNSHSNGTRRVGFVEEGRKEPWSSENEGWYVTGMLLWWGWINNDCQAFTWEKHLTLLRVLVRLGRLLWASSQVLVRVWQV